MKKILSLFILLCMLSLPGCSANNEAAKVVATTRPVYDFTAYLCRNTDISVDLLVSENLSCLHDYTLQVRQMRAIENAEVIVLSGAGLEDFLADQLTGERVIIDSSSGISLMCSEHDHSHDDGHHHEQDPHIWLSIQNAKTMAENICSGLCKQFPQHQKMLTQNFESLMSELETLDAYGKQKLSTLKSRDLITFHDGFSYFADYWNLNILHSLEEESGSEASAFELKELIQIVENNNVPAVFTEINGSVSAAQIIAAETNILVYSLDMGMSDAGYFEAMYHNIDTIKEALG